MRTFGFYIHHQNSTALTVVFEIARDETEARSKAEHALAESLNRTRIDVWEDERTLFSVTRDDAPV